MKEGGQQNPHRKEDLQATAWGTTGDNASILCQQPLPSEAVVWRCQCQRVKDHLAAVLGLGTPQAISTFNSVSPALSTVSKANINIHFGSFTSLSKLTNGWSDFTN